MRVIVCLSVLLGVFACGGEEEGEDHPRRFERSAEEWWSICKAPTPEWLEVDWQYYRSDGRPLCPGDPAREKPHCVGYFGGADMDEIGPFAACNDWPLYCSRPDENLPDTLRGSWECVSPAEAKRRSL